MAESGTQQNQSRDQLPYPHMVGGIERLRLSMRGRRDALRGRVGVSPQGYLTSPFAKELAGEADSKILDAWQECNGAMFELKSRLLKEQRACEEAAKRLSALAEQKARALENARVPRAGDEEAGEHIAQKRRSWRIARVEAAYGVRENRAKAEEERARSAVDDIRCEYQNYRDGAMTREKIARAEFLAKLSAYARGVMKVTPIPLQANCVNDLALDDTPQKENAMFFLQYVPEGF